MVCLRASSLVLLLPLLPLSGCLDEPDRTETFRYAEGVSAVTARTGSGDIDVRRDPDATETYVEAVVYGSATRVNAGITAGELRLTHACPKNAHACAVDWNIVLPTFAAARDFDLDTGSGDVRAEDLVARSLVAESGSGDISLDSLEAVDVLLNSGSGDIHARLHGSLEHVEFSTGSGDISLHLPRGAYDLDIDTGSGDVSTKSVSNDRNAAQRLALATGSGDVTVRGQ